MKQVVISVYGGVAGVAYSSPGVNVVVVDLDGNSFDEGNRILAAYLEAAEKEEESDKHSTPLPG